MKPKTTALYWTLTILFALLMLADGAAGLAQLPDGQAAMHRLGYPNYLMSILGVAKILGAAAVVQPWFRTLKEWAFAGFAFNFLGAAASCALAGLGVAGVVPALVALAVLGGLYAAWKRTLRAVPGGVQAGRQLERAMTDAGATLSAAA